MPIVIPDGYITRPAAKEIYNRSQRALERDVEVALAISNTEELVHWKLFTKDGAERPGEDVTIELVKKLQAEGMVPTWCVAESHLEKHYGRKGTPKPARDEKKPATSERQSPSDFASTLTESAADEKQPKRKESAPSETLPDDTAFLKERIQALEKEKADERVRHDAVVEKLFGQLDVKDRQISAWDELTQGLTKALATGQITPRLLGHAGHTPDVAADQKKSDTNDAEVVETIDPVSDSEEGTAAKQNTKATRKAKSRSKPLQRKLSPKKPRWYETPTLNRIASRFRSR